MILFSPATRDIIVAGVQFGLGHGLGGSSEGQHHTHCPFQSWFLGIQCVK
jgi:hypothetical protein